MGLLDFLIGLGAHMPADDSVALPPAAVPPAAVPAGGSFGTLAPGATATAPMIAPDQAEARTAVPATSLLGRLNEGLASSSNLLMLAGAGLAGGRSLGDAISGALQGATKGAALDQQRHGLNQTYGALIRRGLDAETARAAINNPALLQAVLPALFKPQVRPLTAEQKQALGLPAWLPWFVGPDNKPFAPEGLALSKPEIRHTGDSLVAVDPWRAAAAPVSALPKPSP